MQLTAWVYDFKSRQSKQSVWIAATHSLQVKKIRAVLNAKSLTQTFALMSEGFGLEGASSHCERRTFLTNLANKGTKVNILKTLAGHRDISTTADCLFSSLSKLKAALELV